jgi:2-methylisocitrate lyase-like PEP mutase family enzyme
MSRLGMPDLGIATLNDMRDNATMIASLDRSVPLIADADTGFGGKFCLSSKNPLISSIGQPLNSD